MKYDSNGRKCGGAYHAAGPGTRASGHYWLDHSRGLKVMNIPKVGKRGCTPQVVKTTIEDVGGGAVCRECGHSAHCLVSHVTKHHGFRNASEYREKHGADAPMYSTEYAARMKAILVEVGAAKRAKNEQRRKRSCAICGMAFTLLYPSSPTRTCGKACFRAWSKARGRQSLDIQRAGLSPKKASKLFAAGTLAVRRAEVS
jgi:hypothetical protein